MITIATNSGASAAMRWLGGKGEFAAWGTFDSATVTLEFSNDGGTTWLDPGTDYDLAANGWLIFEKGPGHVRLSWTGGQSAPVAVTATVQPIYA